MWKTYIESHSSSLTAQAGEEQQNKRDEPRARDEDDDVRWRREGCSPGLRHWEKDRKKIQEGKGFNTESQGICGSIRWRRGHTVRFESVRRKRETAMNQKSVKSCYRGVLFKGKPLELFLSGRFGTQWREPQWTACIRDLGGKKAGKETKFEIQNIVWIIKRKQRLELKF